MVDEPERKLTVCVRKDLFRGSAEENIDPIERHGAAAYYRTSRHCPPQDVSSRKLPDCEQRSKDRHQDAKAGYPEGNTSHQTWI